MGKARPPRDVALAVVYSPDTNRILMITSRKHSHLWILPKGGIEMGETSGQAAVREAWEEAGTPQNLSIPTEDEKLVELDLESSIGKPERWHVHLLKCNEEDLEANWMERHERQRAWFTPRECMEKIGQWSSDPTGGEQSEVKEKKKVKKARKGDAMETALHAFVNAYGWDRS